MHRIASLRDLPLASTRAVIINCSTKWTTTLALASALANTDFPVLLIDCESTDNSQKHFEWLAHTYNLRFHWLDWPLRSHPAALDALFQEIQADLVLLVDSDVEIRTPRISGALSSALADSDGFYGAGFVHGPKWIGPEHGLLPYTGYYAERMWIPLVLLRTKVIRHALEHGQSFANRRLLLGTLSNSTISRLMALRHRIRGVRHLRLPMTFKRKATSVEFQGQEPKFIEYDTGADMHNSLLASGYRFAALSEDLWPDISHYHGVTRATLADFWRRSTRVLHISPIVDVQEPTIISEVKSRLATVYGIQAPV